MDAESSHEERRTQAGEHPKRLLSRYLRDPDHGDAALSEAIREELIPVQMITEEAVGGKSRRQQLIREAFFPQKVIRYENLVRVHSLREKGVIDFLSENFVNDEGLTILYRSINEFAQLAQEAQRLSSHRSRAFQTLYVHDEELGAIDTKIEDRVKQFEIEDGIDTYSAPQQKALTTVLGCKRISFAQEEAFDPSLVSAKTVQTLSTWLPDVFGNSEV